MKSSWHAASVLLAALMWTIALIADGDPFQPAGVLLIGFGLLTTSAVSTVGMIVAGGRWAHRLGLVSLAITAALAVVREIDALWVIAATMSAIALIVMLGPTLASRIRKLPAATGPSPRAVLAPLVLLVVPTALGLTGNQSAPWALLVVGLTAPLAAFLFSRVLPGGLISIRVLWPALAIVLAPFLGWWAGAVAIAAAVTVLAIAWGASVKTSFHPPREVGSAFRIPPELTPKEILDAAQIDDEGRRI